MVAAAGDHLLRHRMALWIAFGVAVTLILRAPWGDAALGRDEGGVAMIARAWHGGGPFAYGSYFLDRPPLLVSLYRLAGDGETGIRVLGAVAASLLVVTSTLIAVRIGGRRAAPWAAGISAVLASSFELKSIFTPAELLAVVPSSASVLLLLIALERAPRRLWLFAGAGALAATALLVKQSFGDALAAGVVALFAGKLLGVSWRDTTRRASAYASGVAALLVALLAWALVTHTPAGAVWYAMFGFRIDSVSALAQHGLGSRLSSLGSPLLASGLAVAVLFAVAGIARLRDRRIVCITFAAWMAAAVAGILLGGSYWPHYLIELVPAAAAGAAVMFQRYRVVGALAMVAIALPTATHAANVARTDAADTFQQSAVMVGRYIRARSFPNATAWVMYSKVNVLYYTGLRDPYPYNWSLMVRAVPGAEARLRRLLASPQRPTWIVRVEGPRGFGFDSSGGTKRLLAQHYRLAASVCGTRLLLARGARTLPAPRGYVCTAAGNAA
jgi:4-amino-4-deoxy-L-arabinose transferase-like glycosyltransferase